MSELPRDLPPQITDPLAPIPHGELGWQFEPTMYVDQDKIGINARAIGRVARAAGFSGVTVTGYQGETTTYDTNSSSVSGMNFDSSAVGAASGKVIKAPLSKVHIEKDPLEDELHICNRWPRAHIALNKAEIANRVSTRKSQGDAQHAAWAKEISSALRTGLSIAAAYKASQDLEANFVGSSVGLYNTAVALGGVGVYSFRPDISVQLLGISTAIYGAISGFKLSFNHKKLGDALIKRHRLSLMPLGVEVDRLVLAELLCITTSRFAKRLGKEPSHS